MDKPKLLGGGTIKPMPMPEAPELKRAVQQVGAGEFAYHPPPPGMPKTHDRMKRPHGGHGPHN